MPNFWISIKLLIWWTWREERCNLIWHPVPVTPKGRLLILIQQLPNRFSGHGLVYLSINWQVSDICIECADKVCVFLTSLWPHAGPPGLCLIRFHFGCGCWHCEFSDHCSLRQHLQWPYVCAGVFHRRFAPPWPVCSSIQHERWAHSTSLTHSSL